MSKIPKIIAKTIEDERNQWEIYDNFTLKCLTTTYSYKDEELGVCHYDSRFMSFLRRLTPGKQYRWCSWSAFDFEECFSLDMKRIGGVTIDFYGFDPFKCKECGFETDLKVCPNCGEWRDE